MRAHMIAGSARQHCCHALSGNPPPLPILAKRLGPILFSPVIAGGSLPIEIGRHPENSRETPPNRDHK
jgi:hypothetical protein